MRPYLLALVSALFTAISNLAVHAVVVISNLEEPWPEPGTIGEIHGVFPGETYSVQFWTGDGSFTVDSVTLEHILFYDPTALPNFRAQIYKEVLAPPFPNITLVGELMNPELDPTPTQWPESTAFVKYTPTAPILLEPNSLYWVAAHVPPDAPDNPGLLFVPSREFTGLCGWELGHFRWFGFFEEGEQRWVPGGSFEALKFKLEARPVSGEIPPCNDPPDVSAARASLPTFWPPNGSMVPITIDGVTDPDGDPVSIRILRIEQDEPVTTADLDVTTPDGAGVQTDSAEVRAERLESGNGRVYRIVFSATDGRPRHQVIGFVYVEIPHDRGAQATAIDDGPANGYYDSLDPQP